VPSRWKPTQANALNYELATRIASGATETNIVSLVENGSLQVADVDAIVRTATDALASHSANHATVLGLNQTEATAVMEAKIDAIAFEPRMRPI
jgi:hypothetical protein